MEFARKNIDKYHVQYSKTQAIVELKMDSRVSKIIKTRNGGLIIYTNPIVPQKIKRFKTPIGTYRIVLKKGITKIIIDIKRNEGSVDEGRHHYHITHGGAWSNPICWGNVEYEIDEVCYNKDWYWAGKMCLNLLSDCKKEYGGSHWEWRDVMEKLIKDYKEETNGS